MELLAQDIIEQDIIGKIGGCGAELNREIVSRCVVCLVRSGSKSTVRDFPLFLFAFPPPPISYPASAAFAGII